MRNEVEEAITQIIKTVRTKNDAFLVLCSLNLLNAAVKKDEYKGLIGYGLIKPAVAKFVQFCLEGSNKDLVDEIYYNAKERCVYIRCFGIQFSFHNIDMKRISPNIISSISNETVKWDGVKLQLIALELYYLANECTEYNICDTITVKERIQGIINESQKNKNHS